MLSLVCGNQWELNFVILVFEFVNSYMICKSPVLLFVLSLHPLLDSFFGIKWKIILMVKIIHLKVNVFNFYSFQFITVNFHYHCHYSPHPIPWSKKSFILFLMFKGDLKSILLYDKIFSLSLPYCKNVVTITIKMKTLIYLKFK